MTVSISVDELAGAAVRDLGDSDWQTVTQERIDAFARATGDDQWIHVDRERAASGPYGATIAHGFLTLSLLPVMLREIYTVSGAAMAVNYGVNRVRFPAPLRSGSQVRAHAELIAAERVPGGVHVVTRVTVTARDAERPCCVAELVTRFIL